MADISSIQLPSGNTYDVKDILGRQSIPYGIVTSDSTTVFTATVDGVTQLSNGVCCLIRNNNKQTSASGWTLNVNGLGAKPVYNNMADATRDTTIFNKVYTMLFVYDEDRVDGGCWICYRGYNSDNNTIGYQIRHNSSTLNVTQKTYRYRLLFSGVSLNTLVPANASTSTSSTDAKTVNSTPINPFGPIYFYNYTSAVNANASPSAVYLWQQYAMNLGYSFTNATALALTSKLPVFLKCAPQNDGSAIIDSTEPIVQALPSSADGKIYILLGIAYSATNLELCIEHPVFYYDGTATKVWTGASGSSSVAWSDITGKPTFATVATSGSYNDLSDKPTIPSAVTESTVAGWGFTKNTGTYSKPSGGIPKTDLASAVQTSLGKADTALQSYTESDPIFTASAAHGITSSDITSWNNKGTYSKPSGGIPKTDLASAVQTSLGKADTALQSYTETDPIFTESAAYGISSSDISDWNGKADGNHTHTVSDITDFPSIPSLSTIYPIGAIYISTSSTSPASLFGGTWEQLSGQFLLASNSTYTAGSSGGSATVTLTVDQIPSHQHKPLYMDTTSYKLRNRGNFGGGSYSSAVTTEGSSNNNIFTANTGGGKAHNNMPPYLAVYMWKRTA